MKFVSNSRSTINIETETDHKMVKMEINYEWYKLKTEKKELNKKADMSNFSITEKQNKYRDKMSEINFESVKTPLNKWNEIAQKTSEISMEVMGVKSKFKILKDPEIEKLSNESKKLRNKIDSTKKPT